ncbi:MAG: hypothetical protein ACPGSK_04450, partial [Alphaproteobacteria bacterium]
SFRRILDVDVSAPASGWTGAAFAIVLLLGLSGSLLLWRIRVTCASRLLSLHVERMLGRL